ncbi:MAG: CHAT domain-containing protein, partial [Anaerolineae bacterium]|nr:CHAT domain-containing protein [Anaerolineae bacterium]
AFRRHLAICQEASFTCRTGVSYNNLGEVYARMGPDHYDLACDSLERARRIHRECADDFRALEAIQDLAAITSRAGEDERALAYALEAVQLAEIVRSGITSSEARAGFSVTTTNVYAEAILLAVRLHQLRLAFDLVERSRSRAFLDSLDAGSSAVVRSVEATSIELPQVQQRLAADEVLLEYFTCGTLEGRSSRNVALRDSLMLYLPPPVTLLFAITRDTVDVLDLALSPVDVLPQRLTGAVERHFLQPAIRQTLYGRLIQPVRRLLAEKRRVYIVPHGPLHYVPFGALMDADGRTLLHDGGPDLVYGPSASVLFRDHSVNPGGVSETQIPCLAIGYNGDTGNRLRYAEEEAESIAAMLGGQALTGPASKRALLVRRAADARY